MNGSLLMTGRVQIDFLDLGGNVLRTVVKNRVVSGGLRWAVDRLLNGGAGSAISTIAIGDGAVAVTNGDTALARETARMALSSAAVREEVVADQPSANYTALFDVGTGTGAVTELGLFLASGTMVARTVIPSQDKSSTTSIRVKWTITLKSA